VHAPQLRPLVSQDYDLQRCELPGEPGRPVLRILDAVYLEQPNNLQPWCDSAAIARHFAAVEVVTEHRDSIDLRELHELRHTLVVAKPELIDSAGRSVPGGLGYAPVARYPRYGSQLVSMDGPPQLSAAWLRGKRLGLLDDPNSVSSYQIPMAALRQAGLADVPELVYYRSYRQLYRALFDGEVDVIPGLLSPEGPDSALQLPPGLVLQQTIPGPAWYLRRDLLGSAAHCAVQDTLQSLARDAELDYFRRLRLEHDCAQP
tara:strand:- start:1315 stop:2094 length:780 start_codon:yes stop_codon:yes gene_type:complete